MDEFGRPARTRGRGLLLTMLLALALALALAACGNDDANTDSDADDDTGAVASPAASTAVSDHQRLAVTLTADGCDPASLTAVSGPTTFDVTNLDAANVSELEVLDGELLLAEVHGVTPGTAGTFSLTLQPGTYALDCPNEADDGKLNELGTLTVTGDAVVNGETVPAVQLAVDTYREYLIEQSAALVARTEQFVEAVESGDVEEAKLRYAWAREPYERIEPVAETFGGLDPAIDAREGDVPDAEWGGFHRIEKALWIDESLDGMEPVAAALLEDVRELETLVKDAPLEPARIANGAVELLNEVSASKITGEEERYSHTDLVDFKANLDGARAAFDALRPLLAAGDAALADEIAQRLDDVDAALEPYRQGSGYVSYTELTPEDTRALSQAVDALAEPMSQVAERVLTTGG